MSSTTTITQSFFKKVFNKAIIIVASFAYLFFASGSAFAASQRYDSNGTFTVPTGVVQVSVSMSGGGAGGGSLSNSGAGQNGGTTSFGTLLTAKGGYGGKNGSANGGGAGGVAGGVGGYAGSTGTNIGYGGTGGNSLFGNSGVGNSNYYYKASNGSGNGAGGGGGFDGGGGGGAQAFNNTTISVTPGQVIPITIGAGGAGSTGDSTFFAAGGNGASGFVQITYTADTVAPTATVAYSTTAPTNGNVVATITPSETVTVTNNGGLTTRTFTTNGSFTFNFIDAAGNTGSVTATVSNIDKTAPVITIAPYTLTPTNQNIIVTASTNEGTLNTTTHTFTANGSFDFVATDAAGNVTTSTVIISNIDKVAPVITLLGANPITVAFGSVYTDAGATASDNIDGNITANVAVINSVNTNVLGTYTVSYSVSDSFGNAATQVSRTVTVVDTVAPIITIFGTNPITIAQGSGYTDAGATALDAVDGVRPVTTTGSVNTAIVGAYTLTYTASDLSSNTTTATRTVNVTDQTAPTATVAYSTTLPTNGNVVATMTPSESVTITNNGGLSTYTFTVNGSFTFTFADAAGNTGSVTATVSNIDAVAPVITILGNNPETVTQGGVYTDAGATALDAVDGVRSVATTGSVNTAIVGTYMLTYTASDLSTNTATATRTVNVTTVPDTTAPVITILGNNPESVVINTIYIDAGATSLDNIDGNITAGIVASSTVNTAILGTYAVTYVSTDAALNTATSTRTVNVIPVPDTIAPVITLIGVSPQTVEGGTVYTDLGATALDNVDGDITANIVASSTVNTAVIGTYTVSYNVSDATGNPAIQVVRIVNVVDTVAPVITILGNNPETVLLGSVYTDAGATALDSVNGVRPVTTIGTVNTAVLGTYTVTYITSDLSGNIAVTNRTVNVIAADTTAPVITILGNNPESVVINTTYTDLGATALDNIDGDITANIITMNNVSTSTVGTYTVVYSVSDVAGNTATSTRVVNVIATPDTTAPVITILGNNPETVAVGSVYTDAGATALDDIDGDITAFIVATSTVNTSVLGSYTVTYVSTDASANTATSTRTVNVIAADPLSQVTITNSTVGGIFYASYTPTVASSTALGITGTSTIANSTIVAPWSLADVVFDTVTLTNATVAQTSATNSIIINADLTGCVITNSLVKNYFAVGCMVTDSIVDPENGLNNLTGTTVSGNSQIYYSDVIYSTVISSYIATSTISYSMLINATSTNSTIATSTVTGSTIDWSTLIFANVSGSTVTASSSITSSTVATSTVSGSTISAGSNITNSTLADSTVSASTITGSTITSASIASSTVSASIVNGGSISGSTVASSTLNNAIVTDSILNNMIVLGTGSTITNSTLSNTTVTDAVIVDDIMLSGTIVLPDGTVYTVLTPTPLSSLVNYAPVASFSTTVNDLVVTLADTSSDPNTGAVFADSWTYDWDFGDGATSTVATTTIGNNNQAHTYGASGTYTISLTITDQYGLSNATSSSVTVSTPTPDITPPVISIVGFNPASVVVGNVYTDAGATALDNIDGDITANIITMNNVSTSTVGTYTVVYSVSDLAGNAASSTRIVNVIAAPDTIPPVLALIGNATTSVVVNTSYVDLGATALDNVDGDITAGIVVNNPVDITTIGAYTVLYTSTDSSGNVATTTRTVDVIAQPPVDTIPPSAPIIANINTIATTTLGATLTALWSDSTDDSGSLAGYSFVWDGNVNTNPDNLVEGQATTTTATLVNGTWYFHIVAVDPVLNVSTPTTTLGPIVISNAPAGDTTVPTGPTAVTSSTHTVGVSSATTTVSLDWDTAADETALAGYSYIWDTSASSTPDNIADTAVTSLDTNLTNGTWYFHILSADTSGNVSSPVIDFGPIIIATTTTDIISPVGPTAVTSSSHTVSVASTNQSVIVSWDTATDETALAGYSYIWDNAASTTPDAILETVTTGVTTTLPNGSWYFHILSTDTSGNVSSPVIHFGPVVINTNLPADLIPPTAPVATVATSSATTVNASWTDSTDDSGSLAGYSFVWDTNALTNPDAIAETQSTSTSVTVPDGLWYFHIVAVDPSLNVSTPTTNVGPVKVDTTAPALTLLGATIVPVVIGDSYTDAGATALDTIDGDITAGIIATSTVDTNTLGTYTVTYNVTDSSGNSATPLVRTVIVIAVPDTLAPVITILGVNPETVILGSSYTDLGATATDNVDGNITASIVTTNLVNTAVVGTYSVDYSVSDSSGNIATSSRAVNVIDPAIFTIVASAVGNGTITPNATTTVVQGNSQSYTITPNFGYDFTSLLIDGVSVATTTSYTFTNVQADHTLSAVFTQSAGAPYFTIFASAGANGTVSPTGTTTIQQGNAQTYMITPNAGYSVGTLTIDGVATTTSTTFTFSNINADHTIAVSFIDPVAPVGPTAVTSSSHTPSVISANQTVDTVWDTATDNVALAGYSYAWDMNPATSPDAIVDTVAISATTVLPYGTWYFHVVSVDTSGNASSPTIHFGPAILSDSQVLITNSTIGGTTYTLYSPTVASSTALGVTGSSTITNSGLITSWNIVDTLVATSTLTQVSATSSIILNSVLTNATTTNSTITGSTILNGTIDTSTLTNVQVAGTGSTITGSTLLNTTVTDAVIVNGVMMSGTIVNPSGTTVTVTVPTPLTALINYAPVAAFTASANYLAVTMTDASTDPNSASLPDSWTYLWNFGDGVTASANTATVGNNQTHTYSTAGTYTISLTLTDQYGLSSTATTTIIVSAAVPVVVLGTSGGGGGGGVITGLITGNPLIVTTYGSNAQKTTPSVPVAPVVETPTTIPVVTPVATPAKTPSPAVVQLVPEQAVVTEEVVPAITPVEVVATSTPISNQLATVAEFVTTNSTALAVVGFMTTILALGYFIRRRIALKKLASISFTPTEMEAEAITEEAETEESAEEIKTEETEEENVLIK